MHKKILIAASTAATLLATTALAQGGGAAAARPDPRKEPCPASGFSRPIWGTFGGNDGVTHPYEIAGSCNPQAVQDAAMTMGLARYMPLGLLSVQAVRFSAKGTWVDPMAGPIQVDNLTAHVHFYYPGGRFEITGKRRNAPWSNVEVFNDERVWDETSPGVGPKAVPARLLQDRAVWPKLLPQGAMLSIIEAGGTVKISKDAAGNTVMSGKSPYDPMPVTITLDAKGHITRTVVQAYGHTFVGAYFGYNDPNLNYDEVNNKWEPAYGVPWVDRMTWTKDGKLIADLTTTEFKSNPYTVMPPPEFLKAEAEEADKSLGYDKNNPGDDPRDQFHPDMEPDRIGGTD